MVVKKSNTMKSEIILSNCGKAKYLHRFTILKDLPKLMIICKSAGIATELQLDKTSMMILNNSLDCGYGSVDVLNVFPVINAIDKALENDEEIIKENNKYLLQSAEKADTIVLAYGKGIQSSTRMLERCNEVVAFLDKHKDKMVQIHTGDGRKGWHPLSPEAKNWILK